jgi:hypothetical protein
LKGHPISKFLRCDIWPLKVFGDQEKAPERENGDLEIG